MKYSLTSLVNSIKWLVQRLPYIFILVISLLVLKYIVVWIFSQKPEITAAIITAIASVIVIVGGQQWNKTREIAAAHRIRKIEIYDEFITGLGRHFLQQDESSRTKMGASNVDELVKVFQKFTPKLILWGSSDVIAAWTEFRGTMNVDTASEEDRFAPLRIFDNLLKAIRAGLDHNDSDLPKSALINLFLSNPSELD